MLPELVQIRICFVDTLNCMLKQTIELRERQGYLYIVLMSLCRELNVCLFISLLLSKLQVSHLC
jgi:hypothetical protein